MHAREWALSLFFAVFATFKIAEAALRFESWPASNVAMFSALRPVGMVPFRSRLEGTRGSETFELTHGHFLLSKDEFVGRMLPDDGLAQRCGKLVASYNRAQRDPSKRLEKAAVAVEPIARPGIPSDARGWSVPCVLSPENPTPGGAAR